MPGVTITQLSARSSASRKTDVRMVELRQHGREGLVEEHDLHRRTGEHHAERGEDEPEHTLAWMMPVRGGRIHVRIGVVNQDGNATSSAPCARPSAPCTRRSGPAAAGPRWCTARAALTAANSGCRSWRAAAQSLARSSTLAIMKFTTMVVSVKNRLMAACATSRSGRGTAEYHFRAA